MGTGTNNNLYLLRGYTTTPAASVIPEVIPKFY